MTNPLLSHPGHRPGLPLAWRLGHALTLVLVALLAGAALAAANPGAMAPDPTSPLHPLWGGQQFGGMLEGLALAAALLLAALSRRHPAQRGWCAAAALALLLAWPVPFFVPYDPAAVAELAATPGPISPEWQHWLAEQAQPGAGFFAPLVAFRRKSRLEDSFLSACFQAAPGVVEFFSQLA